MFLKQLIIKKDGNIIRDIPFHKGINLIVDESTTNNRTESGNSVGKTTVLRLIDFCLDGEGKNIYVDPEFKTNNKIVENFLKSNNTVVILTLIENIDDEGSRKIIIERNFLSYKEKIQTINGESRTNDEFSKTLKELIFKTSSKKPSFRQLKSKNIRDEKNKLINTIHVLPPNVTTNVAYEALHLFWLGIDVDLSKDKLVRQKNSEEKLQKRLRKESNLSQIKQSLIIVNKEIGVLTKKKSTFNLNKEYEEELSKLNTIKFEINSVSNKVSRLEMRRELVTESKIDLESDFAKLDRNRIKVMYEKAKSFMPNIQRTFEDTLKFHNDMIRKKIHFISEDLPTLNSEILKSQRNLNLLLNQEASLSKKLNKSDTVEGLESVISELNSFHEKKGTLDEQKRLWDETVNNLDDIQSKLNTINNKIYSKEAIIEKRIEEFNSHFSDISSRLDGVHSLLSADKVDGVYKFAIGNIEGNPGTGSKKSQMASFDLAYIKFADEHNIPCLHFILQDQIENVHANQITNLFTEIVNEVNCQYVLPVLRDKLPSNIDFSKYEVISLSQKSKLFKI